MKRLARAARKLIVACVGFAVVALGLVLIPLPGPGLLVLAGGLFILSLEFDWADRYFQRLKAELAKLFNKARQKDKSP